MIGIEVSPPVQINASASVVLAGFQGYRFDAFYPAPHSKKAGYLVY